MSAIPNPTPDLASAQAAFKTFVENVPPSARCVALHDVDADGVSAGVVWQRGLERLGFAPQRVMPDRERNAWTPANRARVSALQPEALWVLDLGSQPHPVNEGVPTCFVDHHRPEGCPPADTLVCAYAWEPIPTTSLLQWELLRPLVDVEDLDWVACIGLMGDLGDKAPFDLIARVRKSHKLKDLKEVVALVNAPRRAATPDPVPAARALLAHPDAASLANSTSPDVEFLRQARVEVAAALEQGKKAAPTFAGQVALVRVHSPCQIHPLIAQIWRRRLPKYIVMVANDEYLPGRVNFSARSASGINVLEFLRSQHIAAGEGSFGHGHDQASGGSLPLERWNELLVKLGFAPESG